MAQGSFCCSIVPAFIHENIARSGSEAQRARARETLRVSRMLRGRRHSDARLRRPVRMNPLVRWFDFVRARRAARDCEEDRRIYDDQHTQRLPPLGRPVRSEGDPATGDAAVDEAYDGLGATFDLYLDEYNRCSIDDRDMPLIGVVHFGRSYDNAFFDGQQMAFGDGDEDDPNLPESERLWNRFTIAIDIMGHELTHGVTDRTAGLAYAFQPGALNESISDAFGSMVKQKKLGQQAQDADWLIGEGLFTANVNGKALRSMKEPGTAFDDPALGGKDPQPDHMDDFQRLPLREDNGGVHINSGIPNKAFYLAAVNISGFSWEGAGRIWYEALTSPTLSQFANFYTIQYLLQAFPEPHMRCIIEHRLCFTNIELQPVIAPMASLKSAGFHPGSVAKDVPDYGGEVPHGAGFDTCHIERLVRCFCSGTC
jgi:Thermolysin metallopeptidase, alpha-helical domain/Thermolysin metallopeptidase, catalytic domain